MAEKYPLANGLWSNAANWNGGTKPLSDDDVYANNFTVTVNESITVNSLRGTAGAVAVANGQFLTSGSVTVTVTDRVYGGNNASGTLRLATGGALIGNADTSTVSGRATVRIDAGGSMLGDALNADAVTIQGGTMTGNATGSTSRSSQSVVIGAGGIMTGESTGGSVAVACVQVGDGGIHVGNSNGGSANNAFGTQVLNGGCHLGDSTGGTASPGTELRTGGVQIGDATGAPSHGVAGSVCGTGGLFFGDATGGGVSGAHGLSISSGFAQVGTATGNTSGAFGVSATSYASVVIGAESGSFPKSLAGTVLTDTSRYPFAGSGGTSRPSSPFLQQVIG
jgi:fibronectin-binding autotransporter adhesin